MRTYKEYQEHCYSETRLYLNNDESCYNCLMYIVDGDGISSNTHLSDSHCSNSLQMRTLAVLEMLPDTRPDGGAWSYRAVFDEVAEQTMAKYN